jgi:isopentenyl-diphosphate Delta-isomerase
MSEILNPSHKQIILVDPFDNPIGTMEKILTHQYGMLHRAFSVFIFRMVNGQLETLLQRRHPYKYHCANLWSNTCCSHPHSGENLVDCAEQRLQEEMGITAELTEVGKFHYIAQFSNGLVENEIDHVLIGSFLENTIPINQQEVADYHWQEVTQLQQNLRENLDQYTPWLAESLQIAVDAYKKQSS